MTEYIIEQLTAEQLAGICETQRSHIKRLEVDIDLLKADLHQASKILNAEDNEKNKDAHLRNYFAASALPAFIAHEPFDFEWAVRMAYDLAEAMIEKSKKYD